MTESTPLAGASNVVTSQALRNTAAQSKDYAKKKLGEMRQMAKDGDFSIRLFGLFGGIAMVVVSGFGLLGLFLTLQFIQAIVEFYTFLMGFVVIILESGRQIGFLKKPMATLHAYAVFLKFVWGRGALYFVAGSLELTQVRGIELRGQTQVKRSLF